MASFKEIQEAASRIQGKLHRTPVMTSSSIDNLAARNIFFKCDNFQKTGAFKARGALNAVCII